MNKNQFLFLCIAFIFWFIHFLYIPMLSLYIEHLGGTYAFVGIVLASYGVMQFIFRIPIGIGSDLLNNRKVFVILGMIISTLSCFVYAITASAEWVLISRSLAGIAAACWVVFTIVFASYSTEDRLHSAMGNLTFALVLAQLLGMALSSWVVDQFDFKALFWIGVVLGIIGICLSLFITEPKSDKKPEPIKLSELFLIMKEPTLLKVSTLSIFSHSIIFTTMFGFTTAFVLTKGLNPAEISLVVFAFMVPHALAALLIGKPFLQKFNHWRILQFVFALTAIFTFVMAFAEAKWLILLLQMINGFSLGMMFPLYLGMAVEKIEQEKRATAMGAYQAIYAIGMFVGPYVAGVLNDLYGLEASFYLSGVVAIAGFICSSLWSDDQKVRTKSFQ